MLKLYILAAGGKNMRRLNLFRQLGLLSLTVSLGLLSSPVLANNAVEADADIHTKEAVSYFRQGKLQEAQEAEDKSIQENPRNWISHATKSFLYWQEGNVPDAVTEGQKAVMYAPQNATALTNLGHIYQQISDFKDAIAFYKEAQKSAPEDWVPPVCLARCYVGTENQQEALAVLKEMSLSASKDFAWHYQLGVTYLTVDKPDLAIPALTKAVDLSSLKEQKSASLGQLLVALLCDKQIERARSIYQDAIYKYPPRESEPYVQAAAALAPVEDPGEGKRILDAATTGITNKKDHEAFFKLGRIFEEKAGSAITGDTTSAAWLANANSAFQHAVELNPGYSKYHLALAAVLERQGNLNGASQEVAQAKMFDGSDVLASFVSDRFAATKAIATQPKIRAVVFHADGLTCNCQSTKIDGDLRGINGIAVARFSHLKPYEGTIFVDESVIPVAKVLEQCHERLFPASMPLKTPIEFVVTSNEPVESFDKLVRIAQNAQDGNVLAYVRKFDYILPVLPVSLTTEQASAPAQTSSLVGQTAGVQ